MDRYLTPELYLVLIPEYLDYDSLIQLLRLHPRIQVQAHRVETIEQSCWYDCCELTQSFYFDGDLKNTQRYKVFPGTQTCILISNQNYCHGRPKGPQYSWYESGIMAQERNYEDGKLKGKQYDWWETGNIRQIENYTDGKLSGKVYRYQQDGSLIYEDEYRAGLGVGVSLVHRGRKVRVKRKN